jgi:hypothetical protein
MQILYKAQASTKENEEAIREGLEISVFKPPFIFSPAVAGRALIRRGLVRYKDVHFMPRQLAVRWLIHYLLMCDSWRIIQRLEKNARKNMKKVQGCRFSVPDMHPTCY